MTSEANGTAAAEQGSKPGKPEPATLYQTFLASPVSARPENLPSTDWPGQPPAHPQKDQTPTTLG